MSRMEKLPPAREEGTPEAGPATGPGALVADLRLAVGFLTRLPLPAAPLPPHGSLARSMRFFPLVGLLVGTIGALVYTLAHLVLAPALAALMALAATMAATGALHEDGLADVADGFGGGADRTKKLAIMKDSRIGSYGVLAMALCLLLRAQALAGLASPLLAGGALIAAHALARAAIPLAMQWLRPAAERGLGASAGRPDAATAGIAATIALGIAALSLPAAAALAASLGAAVGALAMALLARRQIGGYTGDVLGALEQLAETAALVAAAATL